MAQRIVLTTEQAQVYNGSMEPVSVCDREGRVLGTLPPDYSAEFIAELKRRASVSDKRYSSEEVTQHMKALAAAWERDGPFDREGISAALNSIRTEDGK